jgi:hypothetical protein
MSAHRKIHTRGYYQRAKVFAVICLGSAVIMAIYYLIKPFLN